MAVVGSIQLCRAELSDLEVQDICTSLQGDTVKLLSVRECKIKDGQFDKLMIALGECKSILHLNLNVGVVSTPLKIEGLCGGLLMNRSLTALLLHGSLIGDKGFDLLAKALLFHPHIVTLDLGDCDLGDLSVDSIIHLLLPNGAKPGLRDLTLSANPDISENAWMRVFMALAASPSLTSLYLDYNQIGDQAASCLAVALVASKSIRKVDLEGTGITEHSAQMLLHAVKNYSSGLTQLVLLGNKIKSQTLKEIGSYLAQPGLLTQHFNKVAGYDCDVKEGEGSSSDSEGTEIETEATLSDTGTSQCDFADEKSDTVMSPRKNPDVGIKNRHEISSERPKIAHARLKKASTKQRDQLEHSDIESQKLRSEEKNIAKKIGTFEKATKMDEEIGDLYALPHQIGKYRRAKKREEEHSYQNPPDSPRGSQLSDFIENDSSEEGNYDPGGGYETIDQYQRQHRTPVKQHHKFKAQALPRVPPRDNVSQVPTASKKKNSKSRKKEMPKPPPRDNLPGSESTQEILSKMKSYSAPPPPPPRDSIGPDCRFFPIDKPHDVRRSCESVEADEVQQSMELQEAYREALRGSLKPRVAGVQ